MTRTIQLLVSLLAFQLCFALLLWWRDVWPLPEPNPELLLAIEPARVTSLEIRAGDESVNLRRDGGVWFVDGDGSAKVDPDRVNVLLDQLAALEGGWPIADTEAGQQRFEVGDDNAQRVIVIRQGDRQTTLLLGTSPALRRVHARLAGSREVYNLEFAHYEAPALAADWLVQPETQPAPPSAGGEAPADTAQP